MRSGRLDRQIQIETLTETQDATGQPVESWSTLATIWAERETSKVVERFQAQQRFATAEVVFRVRWYPFVAALDPKTARIVFAGRIYNILGSEEIGRKDGLHIPAIARADLGGLPG